MLFGVESVKGSFSIAVFIGGCLANYQVVVCTPSQVVAYSIMWLYIFDLVLTDSNHIWFSAKICSREVAVSILS